MSVFFFAFYFICIGITFLESIGNFFCSFNSHAVSRIKYLKGGGDILLFQLL